MKRKQKCCAGRRTIGRWREAAFFDSPGIAAGGCSFDFRGKNLAQPLLFDNLNERVRNFIFSRQAMAGWRNFVPLSVVGAAVFFGGLWLLGFPKPANDDLFYSGAALNLASGGDFSNPLLARQGFPSHYFFVYPPLHSFVLAGWLGVFGISAMSMVGFAVMMLWLTCAATVLILRR